MKLNPRHATRSQDDRGATAVEYGLMVAFIAATVIASVMALGGPVMGLYERANWW